MILRVLLVRGLHIIDSKNRSTSLRIVSCVKYPRRYDLRERTIEVSFLSKGSKQPQ